MKSFKSLFSVALCLLIISCNPKAKEVVEEVSEMEEEVNPATPSPYVGNYVTEGYFEKEKGYDWVAVSVKGSDDKQLLILVNSRDDIKKPTCTFEAMAQRVSDAVYKTTIDDKTILFTFTNSTIKISPEKDEDKALLHFYCSGGATLEGVYQKVE